MPSIFKFLQGARGRGLLVGLLTFLLLAPLSLSNLGQALENLGLDLGYRLRSVQPPPPELLIVGIDEASFQELRRPWPWPRRLHAELIRRLAAAGASLIIFDVIFADSSTPEDDQLFAASLDQAGNVILGQTVSVTQDPSFSRQILVQPLAAFRRAARGVGLAMITPDADGVVRHFRLRLFGQETLPAVAVKNFRPQMALPPDLSGLIDYTGPQRSIDTVSYYQVLDEQHPLPATRIRGRIVLVGRMLEASVTPQDQADSFLTPYFARDNLRMAGVEIQGQVMHTLLRGSWGRELPRLARIFLYLAVFLQFSLLLVRLSPPVGLAVLAGSVLAVLGISLGLFIYLNYWAPPILICGGLALIYGGNVLSQYLIEAQEKRWLRQAFKRYISPALVEAIIAHPERLELGGEEVEVTVLFADLEGFTSLSEGIPPHDLVQVLNEYFTPMTRIILEHRGTMDKYIGDALMALWGAPVHFSDHALHACAAALEMQAGMEELQREWLSQGLPPLRARLGFHSGPVIAGNIGSLELFNYTAIGDTVNLASRLEGANKVYGTTILLSDSTCRLVEEVMLVREVDLIQVKGREQPVTIYELLGRRHGGGRPEWLEIFAAGREAYKRQDWQEALGHFQTVLRLKPDDQAAVVFLGRCLHFQQQPPPPDWQGVYVLESK
ncbi:MAG: adenylate/guanylate cyclase domain-containing protein [Deltaproteobacteria bacterium]|nr:adenylate/guanylate cyclase domain-containing protein [Deltaproteobacteria bacterium]